MLTRARAVGPFDAGGGRFLELGCGVAGGMLTLLQAVPEMHAVDVELNRELSAEARRRSVELGVSDRVEIVTGDAATFRDEQPFDFGFWSQAFFPAPTREAALRTLFDSVRSGGHITAPVFGRHEVIAADPGELEARNYAIWRVMLDGWGCPRTDDRGAVQRDHGSRVCGPVDRGQTVRDDDRPRQTPLGRSPSTSPLRPLGFGLVGTPRAVPRRRGHPTPPSSSSRRTSRGRSQNTQLSSAVV